MSEDANGATVYGLDVKPLPEGQIPLEAIVVVRCLDEDGDPTIEIRATGGIKVWDAVGLLTVATDVSRAQAAALWDGDDEEDEDDGGEA